jgi:hypothetical protein
MNNGGRGSWGGGQQVRGGGGAGTARRPNWAGDRNQ